MEFTEILEKRHSVRTYINRPVDDEAVDALLEAIQAAPSGGNRQAYKVAVVRDDEKRRRLAEASRSQAWMLGAPVFFVFFADIDRSKAGFGEKLTEIIPMEDAVIAMTYAQLAAFDLGLGTCLVAPFALDDAQEICGLEGNLIQTGILTVGHSTETAPKRKRRKIQEWAVRI
jgi:nitroreductase